MYAAPSRASAPSHAATPGRVGSDVGGSQQRLGGLIHEAQLGIVPVRLEGARITENKSTSFRRYIETLARSQIYNRSVWTNNIDELAWSVLDLRVQETQVAREHPQGAELWHEKWPLDTILDALKEAYDPQRFDLGHEKWYKWIRDNKPHLEVDYLRLEEFRDACTHKLNEARIKFGEPPAQHHKDILKELQGMLTTTGNIHRRESSNMEFQEALNKACLAV